MGGSYRGSVVGDRGAFSPLPLPSPVKGEGIEVIVQQTVSGTGYCAMSTSADGLVPKGELKERTAPPDVVP